ncbi:MAG TPA: hypothetical protein VI072_01595 [Polyangiaceae bacterium]
MNPRAWILAVGVAATLVACHGLKPGEASLRFDGERTGQFKGGGVTCPPISSISATWQWAGDVGGRRVSVVAAALNSSGIPDSLLINSENVSWKGRQPYPDEPPADGQFTARIDEKDKTVLHIEGSAINNQVGPIKVSGSLRCPCANPPCFP